MSMPSAVTYRAVMRRISFACVLLVAAALSVMHAGPAFAEQSKFRVDTQISLGLHDAEIFFEEDERCGFGGTTSQELLPSDGVSQLGVGRPGVDYSSKRGPFRNSVGDVVEFLCGGEVSVCFHPARVSVTSTGDATITMAVKFFEGWHYTVGVPAWPCRDEDLAGSTTITLSVPAGARGCIGQVVTLRDGGNSVTIGSFCATVTRIGTAPVPVPPPAPVTITAFNCESLNRRFTCDVAYSGGTGTRHVQWFVNGTRISALDDQLSVDRTCQVDREILVRVVVVDAANASASRTDDFVCVGLGS
jgi:hypothetical protein